MNWKKIALFLMIAFSFSWSVFYLLNFLGNSLNSSILQYISTVVFMFGPAVSAFIVQKLLYKDSLKSIGFNFDKSKLKSYLQLIVIFLLLFAFTFLIIFLFGNLLELQVFGKIDFSSESFNKNLFNIIKGKIDIDENILPNIPALPVFFVLIIQGIIAGFSINIPVMFGEEFGWRGLLLEETKAFGFIKSTLFIGFFLGSLAHSGSVCRFKLS